MGKINKKLLNVMIYILPLGISLLFILILKYTIGNEFPYNVMVPRTILLIMIFVNAFLIVKKSDYTLVISILSSSLLSSTIWMMFGADTILGGRGGDNGFEMVMVSRFMNGIGSQDVVYANLSNFYPFYYQMFIGKLALLFDWSYYKALKYGAFLTIYFMPIASYYLWKNIYSNRVAFLMTLGTLSVISVSMYFRKSFEVISLVLIVPWWIYYFNISKKNIKNAIVGGLIGGILFSTYYYWFFPIVLASVYILITEFKLFRMNMKYYGLFFITFFIASSIYLVPYLYDLVHFGSEAFQNRYFRASHLRFPLENIKALKNYIFLFSLVYLIMYSRNKVERYLLILISSSYMWILFGHFGIILDAPLLTVKIVSFINLILSLSVILMLNKIFFQIKEENISVKESLSVGLLILMIIPTFTSISNMYKSKDLKAAKNIHVTLQPFDAKLASIIEGNTILAARKRMTMSLDTATHFFTSWSSFFSHPSAILSQRLIFLKLLSQSNNSHFVHWMLKNNKFSPIDYVWLKENRFDIDIDDFPKSNPSHTLTIEFNNNFFSNLKKIDGYAELYQVSNTTSVIEEKLTSLEKNILYYFSKNMPKNRQQYSIFIDNKKLYYLDFRKNRSIKKERFYLKIDKLDSKYFKFKGLSGKYGSLLIKEIDSKSISEIVLGNYTHGKNIEIGRLKIRTN